MNPLPFMLGSDETHAVLSAILREVQGTDTRLEGWSAHPFLKFGKRRAARYDVDARSGGESHVRHYQWVGKLYERDDDARKVATVLRDLAAIDCGARGGLAVPRVVAYHAPRRLLLLTFEAGEPVSSVIAHDPRTALPAIGRALAALHTSPVTIDAVTSAAAVLSDLRTRIAERCTRFPGETAFLQDKLMQLERDAALAPSALSFVHGDFGLANLLWRAGQIVVLDFDKCAIGDPAQDLGNLLCQLLRSTLRKPGGLPDFDSMRVAILDAYQRYASDDPGLVERVAWYEQATLLRKLLREPFPGFENDPAQQGRGDAATAGRSDGMAGCRSE